MKVFAFLLLALSLAFLPGVDDVMRKEGDVYIINTTTLCSRRGFKDITPVEVYICHDKVVRIEALGNKESKGYFNPLTRRLFPLYDELGISAAKSLAADNTVDAITGATFSGKAIQANIAAALDYYESHR